MEWDLGLRGFGVLLLMSLGFGIIAQLIARKVTTRRLWPIATAAYFLAGLLVSEVWFGWATEEELQPNIDGLSFDEVLLLGLVGSILTFVVTWWVTRRRRRQSTGIEPVEADETRVTVRHD